MKKKSSSRKLSDSEKRQSKPEDVNDFLESKGSTPLKSAVSLFELLRRPEIKYDDTAVIDDERPALSSHQKNMMEVQIKYEGYIQKQQHVSRNSSDLKTRSCLRI